MKITFFYEGKLGRVQDKKNLRAFRTLAQV
jgi:hypothetical protein